MEVFDKWRRALRGEDEINRWEWKLLMFSEVV